jgi:hypothetical protein
VSLGGNREGVPADIGRARLPVTRHHQNVLAVGSRELRVQAPEPNPSKTPKLSCTTLTALLFAFALLTQDSAWMMATDRIRAVAAADGPFFGGFFGVFHPTRCTPVRMNVLRAWSPPYSPSPL